MRVVELVGEAAEEFRKYVVYYLQEYTLALNRIVDSDPFMLKSLDTQVQVTLKEQSRYYGRQDFNIMFSDNNILMQSQSTILNLNKAKLFLVI